MTIKDILKENKQYGQDSEVLLASVLEKDRSWLLAHGNDHLSKEDEKTFAALMDRRKTEEPVAYILGYQEFYGVPFKVNRNTLIPRPATEKLIDHVLDFLKTGEEEIRDADTEIVTVSKKFGDIADAMTIVDIGTGSGCIAVTLAHSLPQKSIMAVDSSAEALLVAEQNAKELLRNPKRIHFLKGNLLEPLQSLKQPFIVVSNPPYVPTLSKLDKSVRDFEPPSALYAGIEGTEVIENLWQQAKENPFCRGIVLECREEQTKKLV